MQLESLKLRTQEIVFVITRPILKQNLTKASNFLSIRDAFQRQELEWETAFVVCADDLDGLESKVNMMPHVTMEEVSPMVSRFIEHIATQEDRDAPPRR